MPSAPTRAAAPPPAGPAPDAALASRLDAVCEEGWALFEAFDRRVRDRGFHPFVAADYAVVRAALVRVRHPGQRFLELGSATGVITVMASLLGFDACGIELDRDLVQVAVGLNRRHGTSARFACGSFLPTGYRRPGAATAGRSLRAAEPTTGDGASGYLVLGQALDDFDVVFGYPWSGEAPLMHDLMRQYGRPDALLLLHDTNAGVSAWRQGRELAL
ncbi:MAG: hypothetical protein IT355_20970 [Gemmatimonadaceae bacterium]|nr:hypothetical protein [Gemmatimonadaceae bacterium]